MRHFDPSPTLFFKRLFLLIVLQILSLNAQALECVEKKSYHRCDYEIKSKALGADIPVFLYIPSWLMNAQESVRSRQSNLEFALFLHGRGYARSLGSSDSMLEHLNIDELLSSKAGDHLIFVAPQDNIKQSDTDSIGQDYWIGAGSRNWIDFLAIELPLSLNEKAASLEIQAELSLVMGISMGAHGALMLSQTHPEIFKTTIALSPIFRSTREEIGESDWDVFLKSGEPMLKHYNFGAKLLVDEARLADHYFIEISEKDFGLDEQKFPTAPKSWQTLFDIDESQDNGNHVALSDNPMGHSHEYWKEAMPRALEWHQLSH